MSKGGFMKIKDILSTSKSKTIFLSIFLIIGLIGALLRTNNDLKNMKVDIVFENSSKIEFFDGKNIKNKNAVYIIPKDATNINLEGINLNGKKFGILEFNISETISKEFAKNLSKDMVITVHYIKPEELSKYNEKTLFKRLWRAVVERSIDLIVLPKTPMTESVAKAFKNYFKISDASPYIPNIEFKYFFSTVLILFVLYLFPYAIFLLPTLYFSYEIFISLVSILGTVVIFFKIKDNVLKFFSYFTLGILTNLSLYDFEHLNNIKTYWGVKLSLVLLPSILLIQLIIKENKKIKSHLKFLIPLFTIFGIYYIIRSGNFGFVTDFERNIREFIEDLFIIRPRTKELLFYPLAFLIPYLKSNFYKKLSEIFASIAFLSTFNTFCHIRAPLFVNIYRELITLFLTLIIYSIFKIFFERGEYYEENKNSSHYRTGNRI